jgi:hypothetical protein
MKGVLSTGAMSWYGGKLKRFILAGSALCLTLGLCSSARGQRPDLNLVPAPERRALVSLMLGT